MITFGMRLKELRQSKKFTQPEFRDSFNTFSDEIKITIPSISHWENGDRFPDEKTIHELARYFGVTKGYIMGDNVNYTEIDINNYNYLSKMLDEMRRRGDIDSDNISENDLKLIGEVIKKDIRKIEEKEK